MNSSALAQSNCDLEIIDVVRDWDSLTREARPQQALDAVYDAKDAAGEINWKAGDTHLTCADYRNEAYEANRTLLMLHAIQHSLRAADKAGTLEEAAHQICNLIDTRVRTITATYALNDVLRDADPTAEDFADRLIEAAGKD